MSNDGKIDFISDSAVGFGPSKAKNEKRQRCRFSQISIEWRKITNFEKITENTHTQRRMCIIFVHFCINKATNSERTPRTLSSSEPREIAFKPWVSREFLYLTPRERRENPLNYRTNWERTESEAWAKQEKNRSRCPYALQDPLPGEKTWIFNHAEP